MGQMKRIAIDLENGDITEDDLAEMGLEFDKHNYTDGAWWAEQDAEMHNEEMAQLESQADIWQLERDGYL